MRNAILAIWATGMAARAVALVCLYSRRLIPRYPCLSLWLGVGLAKSLYLLPGYLGYHYAAPWLQSIWISYVLYLLVAVEVFTLQARHFPVRRFAVQAAAAFATMSVGIAWAASETGSGAWFTQVNQAVPPAVRFTRNYALVCFLFLQGSALLWGLPQRAMRPNVVMYGKIANTFFLVEWLSAFMLAAIGGRHAPWHGIAQLVGVTGPLACYIAIAAVMRKDGHSLPPDPPAPHFGLEDLAEQEKLFMAAAAGGYRAAPQLGGSTGHVGTGSSASETPVE